MRFSIVIPTQDRPALLALAAHHAMMQVSSDMELIVSDNSTNLEMRENSRASIQTWFEDDRFTYVTPPAVLSPPEHFEFALQYASGDYVLFLTDKMMIVPETLKRVEHVIGVTNAEVINWPFATYKIDDYTRPWASGLLQDSLRDTSQPFTLFEPSTELKAKASGLIPRTEQSERDYVTGKLCFGCYRRDLIERIKEKSGMLFGGCTHDYSAMVQALCIARTGALLTSPGVLFLALPPDKSLGSLTQQSSAAALGYYRSFSSPDAVLDSLFVPRLYSSQHNMVASDYVKYLGIHDSLSMFIARYWLHSIGQDLEARDKIWVDDDEMKVQCDLFHSFLLRHPSSFLYWHYRRIHARYTDLRTSLQTHLEELFRRAARALLRIFPSFLSALVKRVLQRHPDLPDSSVDPSVVHCSDLTTAMRHLETRIASRLQDLSGQ